MSVGINYRPGITTFTQASFSVLISALVVLAVTGIVPSAQKFWQPFKNQYPIESDFLERQAGFDGSGAVSEMRYEWVKGTGVTNIANVAAVPLLKRSNISNPDVFCPVLDTGLTLTGVTYGSAFYNAAWARVTPSTTQGGGISDLLTLDFGDQPIELAQNEVLALHLLAVAVIGDKVGGGVEFFDG